MASHYASYYENQIGGGGRISNVFVGAPYQRGHGIGRFLGGLFRSVLPLLTKGAKAVGREALRTGLNVFEDVSGNHIPFKESLKRRATESGENLKRKANEKIALLMNGSGYNKAFAARAMQSLTGRATRRIATRKRSATKGKKKKTTKRRRTASGTTSRLKKRRTTSGKVSKRPTQTSIESSQWVHYKPVSSLSDDGPIEFVIPGHGEEYLDLAHTMIAVSLKVLASGDAQYKVAPVNNFLHSLFNQVDVFFNQKLVAPPNNAYAYRAYIETLLNYGPAAKESHLTTALWYPDNPGSFEAMPSAKTAPTNVGQEERARHIRGGRTLDMIGHLHCDVFNQDKFLLNGVEVRLRLVRSKDDFCLMETPTQGVTHKVVIHDATLLIRRARINPGVLIAHAKTLTKTTAKYPITRVEVKSFTMHSGIVGDTLDNVILGQLPKRIILGFVYNRAFNGDRTLNPFFFQHHSINFLSLYVDGQQIPGKPLQPEFEGNKTWVESYHTLFSGTGIHFQNEGLGISRNAYALGYCLFAFDLTPDLSANCFTH